MFSKNIWACDGPQVISQVEITTNDEVYFSGCRLNPPSEPGAVEELMKAEVSFNKVDFRFGRNGLSSITRQTFV